MTVTLKPHQRAVIDKIKNGCVITGGVGTGKTPTSMVYYYEKILNGDLSDLTSPKEKVDLYVFTTARKRDEFDWQEWGIKLGISRLREESVNGLQMIVESYNNIQKFVDIKDAFIILDEQRMVGNGAWTKSFLKMAKRNRWIMLSATPGDTWEDYATLFIANGFYKNITEYRREHMVYSYYGRFPKLERYLSVGKLVRHRHEITVEMPYERYTTRHIHDYPVDYDVANFKKVVEKRWHVYEKRPLKDVSELFSVMRKVVNSDTSRLTALGELLQKHPRLIVFYNFDYELDLLRSFLGSEGNPPRPNTNSIISSKSRIECGSYSTSATTGPGQPLSKKSPSTTGSQQRSSIAVDDRSTPKTSETEEELWRTNHTLDQPMDPDSGKFRMLSDGTMVLSTASTAREKSPSSEPPKPLSGTPSSESTWQNSVDPKSTGRETLQQARSQNSSESPQMRSSDSEELSPSIDLTEGLVVAEWNGHKHEPVPDAERWVYLVQYVAGAEAWNCVETDAIVFYSMTYSYKNFEQAQGRIDRLNTPYSDLHYYVFRSSSMIDKVIGNSLKKKETFNEKKFFEANRF